MKKILFTMALSLGCLMGYAQTLPNSFPYDLMNSETGYTYNLEDGVVQDSEDPNTFIFTSPYKAFGWSFDVGEMDLYGMGYRNVYVDFGQSANAVGNQLELAVGYYVGEGEGDYEGNSLVHMVSITSARGLLSIPINRSLTRAVTLPGGIPGDVVTGERIEFIRIGNGWNVNDDKLASPTNPIEITLYSAELDGVNPCDAAPNPVGKSIDFNDFADCYVFGIGKPYYYMHAWGWATPEEGTNDVRIKPTDEGHLLKMSPAEFSLAAIFSNLTLPANVIVGDIDSIKLDVYWESFIVHDADGEPVNELEEFDEVTYTELLVYIGDTRLLGEGVGFKNPSAISFSGYTDEVAGVIGEWHSYKVEMTDFFNPAINGAVSGAAGDFGMAGVAGGTLNLNTITFGIGFNAKNGVYYLNNIEIFLREGASVKVVSAASANIYSFPGGLGILGGEKAVIYGIDGSIVGTTSTEIKLPKGVYIVKVGGEVAKVIVK